MDKFSSSSTYTTSTLCARDTFSEKDLQLDPTIEDGRLSTEHQIELNGMCVDVDPCTQNIQTLIPIVRSLYITTISLLLQPKSP